MGPPYGLQNYIAFRPDLKAIEAPVMISFFLADAIKNGIPTGGKEY